MFEIKMVIDEWYREWRLFDAFFICVFKVSLSKPWSRCRYSMVCWIFSEYFFEWCQLQFCAVSAGDSFWAAVWSDLCWHRREIYDRYFCWGDKLGFVSLKLCSDVCHASVICNICFYCAWPYQFQISDRLTHNGWTWLLVFGHCCGYMNKWGAAEGALLGHFFSSKIGYCSEYSKPKFMFG